MSDTLRRRKGITITCLVVLAFLIVLLIIHFNLAYQPQSGRNLRNQEAIGRRADVREEGFIFAVCGDSKDSRYVCEGILRELERDDTAFTVHLGDGVHAPNLSSYAYFLRQLELLRKPLLMVPGESETGGANGQNLFKEIFGEPYYSFKAGDACLIVLDDSSGEGIDEQQEQWLQGELEKGLACRDRFVFMHYPLYAPEGSPPGAALKDAEAARRLQDLFDRYEVTMAFAAHVPGIYQGTWGLTPYTITGGAGEPIDDIDATHRYYNYVKVTVASDRVDYEVVKTPGPPSRGRDLWSYFYGLYTYGFFAVWFWFDLLLMVMLGVVVTALVTGIRQSRRKSAPEREPAPEREE
jgi:hypothetical protein